MPITYHARRLVEFADTDMAGIAHFTNYLKYMEEAEHAFMRTRGLSVVMHDDQGAFGFPKMSAKCDFQKPVRQEQVLDIELTITADDGKSIFYDCKFSCDGAPVAAGQLRVACCRFPQDKLPYPIPIPDQVMEALSKEPSDATVS